MKVNSWIQMGCERREVTSDVSKAEIERVGEDGLEAYIEDAVLDWIQCRYGWGWSCSRMKNDFSFMEDSESVCLRSNQLSVLLCRPRVGHASGTTGVNSRP